MQKDCGVIKNPAQEFRSHTSLLFIRTPIFSGCGFVRCVQAGEFLLSFFLLWLLVLGLLFLVESLVPLPSAVHIRAS